MANTVGSITDWMPIVCSDNPPLGFCSSRQAYLYILYSLKPPFELPTYNNRSGVIRECGVELHFEHVNCIPQNEPLASTCRSFTLPSSPPPPREREPAPWTSPVFPFSYGTEASLAARLSLGHNWVEAMPPLNYYGIHWDLDLCDPNDLHVPGSQLILAPLAATYLIKWRISIVNGPWPGQFNFAILGSSPFRTVPETIGPPRYSPRVGHRTRLVLSGLPLCQPPAHRSSPFPPKVKSAAIAAARAASFPPSPASSTPPWTPTSTHRPPSTTTAPTPGSTSASRSSAAPSFTGGAPSSTSTSPASSVAPSPTPPSPPTLR